MATSRHDAWADLAEDVGTALVRFAERLRAVAEPTAVSGTGRDPTRSREAKLGGAQLRVLEALKADTGNGMSAREVAEATGLKDTNTPRILKALAERGLAAASDTAPRLWSATD